MRPSRLLLTAILIAAPLAHAGVPAIPEIPLVLPDSVRQSLIAKRQPLAEQKLALIDQGESITRQCAQVEKGSPQHQACLARLQRFNAAVETLRGKVNQLADEIDLAIEAEIAQLTARDKELTAGLDKDAGAIRDLGFARRAEDFAEWEQLGADAQAQFKKEVIDAATDQIADKVGDHLLESFSHFDAAKAGRWVSLLEKVEPKPVELIQLIQKVGHTTNKAKIADDARKILLGIERVQQLMAANSREDRLLLGLDLMCDLVPKPNNDPCHAFKTVSTLTVASLYNNAARRVAINEVERLTTMTEEQLHALAKINELMVKRVKERNEVRAKLKELE